MFKLCFFTHNILGDCVKKKNAYIKTFLICCVCFLLFLGSGYAFLNKNFSTANNETEKIPYTQQPPENAGILVEIDNTKTFFYIDFLNEKIVVSLKPEDEINDEIYGYSLDYKVNTTADLIAKITDYLNGIELTNETGKYRYTGAQINELLSTNNLESIERDIIKAINERIIINSLKVDFFSLVIQNSDTNLNIIDCYFWADYMEELCKNTHFID